MMRPLIGTRQGVGMRETTRKFGRLTAVMAVIAVLGAACSGSGDSDPSAADAATGSDAADDATDPATDDDAASEEPAADAGEVVIGAIWPQSGLFEFNGKATLAGAEAAVEDINNAGGIASLGGATLRMVDVDAGSDPEEASSAAERLLRDEPVAVAGAWLSSLSLAVSEVTERAGVSLVTESFADSVTDRGFEYVFDYAPPASQIKDLLLASAEDSLAADGIELNRVALLGDNSAAATPLQDALQGEFEAAGIEIAVQEQWAPPLQDASGIAQKVAAGDVDAVFLIAFSFNDVSTLVAQMQGRGVEAPIIQNGGQALLPQWQDVGEDVLGMASFVITHPLQQSQDLAEDLAARVGQPFVWQDQLDGYFAVQVIAAALEESGEATPDAVRDALANMDLTSGPAVDVMPTDSIRFDDTGRIDPPFGVLVQWQQVDGEIVPCTVYPADYATCEADWS